jgi:hypothetical protein
MDRVDKIRQESKRQYAELMRAQAHGVREFGGFEQSGRERAGNGPMMKKDAILLMLLATTTILDRWGKEGWRRGPESNR